MAKVFKISENIEYRKAKKKLKGKSEKQLSLFTETGNILNIVRGYSWFEYALSLDEHKDSHAENAYLRAIEENDNPADSYCNLGIIYSGKKETDKAFDSFLKALEIKPRHFETHINIANLYFEEKDFRCALLHYKIAHNINPEFYHLKFNIGLSNLMLQNYDEALEYLITYKEINQDEKADELIAVLKNLLKN